MATENCVHCGKLFQPTNSMITICPSCRSAVVTATAVDGPTQASPKTSATTSNPTVVQVPVLSHVKVIDIDMPFGSMVSFMVKWAIASIPAFIILFVIWFIASSVLFGIFRR